MPTPVRDVEKGRGDSHFLFAVTAKRSVKIIESIVQKSTLPDPKPVKVGLLNVESKANRLAP